MHQKQIHIRHSSTGTCALPSGSNGYQVSGGWKPGGSGIQNLDPPTPGEASVASQPNTASVPHIGVGIQRSGENPLGGLGSKTKSFELFAGKMLLPIIKNQVQIQTQFLLICIQGNISLTPNPVLTAPLKTKRAYPFPSDMEQEAWSNLVAFQFIYDLVIVCRVLEMPEAKALHKRQVWRVKCQSINQSINQSNAKCQSIIMLRALDIGR